MLPSFGREPLEEVYQGYPLIYRFAIVWMDEFVFKPRKSSRVKGLDAPVDHALDMRAGSYPNDKTAKYRMGGAKGRHFSFGNVGRGPVGDGR
jgi:hypothetical protein